jgi:hypothetical protein
MSPVLEGPTRWQEALGELEQAVDAWGHAHPEATLTEIEHLVDQHVQRLRARMVADLAAAVTPLAVCPHCGERLRSRGTHTRTLRGAADQPLPLTRQYATCSGCGAGLFPPG